MSPPLPPVSVVIPARNEARFIEAAVQSALDQDYPGPFEVVVADGMSTDGTRERLAALAARDPRLRIVENRARSTPAGLNAAIRVARGEVIVRCDGHALLPRHYVQRAVELLESTGADNVGGVQAAEGERPLQRAIALAMSLPLGVGDARHHYGGSPGPADTVYLGTFRKAMLERVGLFDETLARSQDSELNHRIRLAGGKVYFHPDLRVTYRPRSTWGELWRQYWRSGAWKREVLRRHPRSLRWRQLAPPLLVVGLAGSAMLVPTHWRGWGGVVPAAYLAAVLGASAWTGLRRREPAAVLLPAVLPTMHLAWGLGLLVGRARRGHPPATSS